MPALPATIDTLIIGAGAAGLAAARHLQSAGQAVLVLEAADRVGGRAWTDQTTFSAPIDRGCAWLHQADQNPFTPMARSMGLSLPAHDDAPWHLYAQGRRLPPDDEALALAAVEQLEQRIDAHRGPDAALSTLSDLGLWSERWASEALGPLDAGADSSQLSIHGLQLHGSTRPNWLVREGFGTIVASLAQGVPVALGERVREIDSRGPHIQVQTTGGTVRSRDCIVTVSTGVLRAEGIRFLPGLPRDTLRALDALPMGHFAKIILEFDGPIAGLPHSGWVMEAMPAAGQTLHFLCHPFGSNLVVGLVGGAYGEALAALPEALAVQEGLARLVQCVGPLHPRRLMRGAFTNWAADPLHRGGYAYLKPGGGQARQWLGMPVHERLYFAGEAVAQDLAQTCGGAFLSGQQAAQQILQRRPRGSSAPSTTPGDQRHEIR